MQLKDISMISRFGSDKFLILIENLSNKQESAAVIAEEYAKQILEITKEPFVLKDKTFYLTCSIGIALFFDNVETSALLLNQSEYAMRTAKKDGKNVIRFYDSSLQETTKSRSLLIQNIKEALKERRFFVLYQKQFDKDEKPVGVEALIRWRHPTIGVISPAEFIPLAEESGVIKEIGRFVLENATDMLISWANDNIKKEWRVSVNVSPLQFRDADFVDEIKELISTKMIDPNKLRLELTEGVLIDNQKNAMKKIEELNAFGVSLSIDDFGTGYSSLGYLKHLKIDELKIDQSFVYALLNNNSDKTIVKTIILMGKEFNFEVIAEGVETKEQFELLKEMGCDLFQGYYLSIPSKAEDL
jgi:EAL domain-containing protein (putative c-di-GMP-specific phosphodiesterase class I)